MALKDLLITSLPQYAETLVSDKQISFRPMVVSEEKALLLAIQSGNKQTILQTLMKIISGCFDSNKDWSVSEFEHMFLLLRAKSIGETEGFVIKCPQTEEEVSIKINLTKQIRLIKNKTNNKIKLNESIMLILKEPTVKTLLKYPNYKESDEELYAFIGSCIKQIQKEKEIIDCSEITEKEKIDFIENLTSGQFKELVSYFDTLSHVEVFSEYETSDGVSREINIRGLFDFISFFLTI